MSENNTPVGNTESVENVDTNDTQAETQESTNQESEKTFTQSEVNSLLAENKRSLKAKYADYDELKETVSKLDDVKTQAYEDGKKTATNELVGRLVETEIRSTAKELGFADSSDAITFFGDKSEITYDPEKGLDLEAINTRLKGLAETKPYLLKTEQVRGTLPTSRPQPKSGAPVSTETDDVKERAASALRHQFKK